MNKTQIIQELQKLCYRSFPGRLEQRVSLYAETVEDGCRILSVGLSWREGGRARAERLLARYHSARWTWWQFDDAHLARREGTVMRWLYGQGLPVPPVYAIDGDFILLPQPGAAQSLSPEQHLDEVVDWLARLHSLPAPTLDVLPVVTAAGELVRIGDVAQQCGDGGLADAVGELRAAVSALEEYAPRVLHGDLLWRGAVCDARGITALPHWAHAALGDPRWDVARHANALRRGDDRTWADRLIELYGQKTGLAWTRGDVWTALTAAQGWALTTWLRHDAPDAPVMAERAMWMEQTWRALIRLKAN